MSLDLDGVSNVHPAALRAVIQIRFGSVKALADRFRAKPNTVQAAISRPQPEGNHIIASALGYEVHQLWPKWFRKGGLRIRKTDTPDLSHRDDGRSRQKSAAA